MIAAGGIGGGEKGKKLYRIGAAPYSDATEEDLKREEIFLPARVCTTLFGFLFLPLLPHFPGFASRRE